MWVDVWESQAFERTAVLHPPPGNSCPLKNTRQHCKTGEFDVTTYIIAANNRNNESLCVPLFHGLRPLFSLKPSVAATKTPPTTILLPREHIPISSANARLVTGVCTHLRRGVMPVVAKPWNDHMYFFPKRHKLGIPSATNRYFVLVDSPR